MTIALYILAGLGIVALFFAFMLFRDMLLFLPHQKSEWERTPQESQDYINKIDKLCSGRTYLTAEDVSRSCRSGKVLRFFYREKSLPGMQQNEVAKWAATDPVRINRAEYEKKLATGLEPNRGPSRD